jgi:hypothetical protein
MDLYSFLIFSFLLAAPPVTLGVAWYLWLRTPEDFEIAQWRRVLVYLGLLCASANFVLFCARIIQLNIFHGRYGLHSSDWQSRVAGCSSCSPYSVRRLAAAASPFRSSSPQCWGSASGSRPPLRFFNCCRFDLRSRQAQPRR